MNYRCDFCKAPLTKNDTFCPMCGAVVPEIKEEPAEREKEPAKQLIIGPDRTIQPDKAVLPNKTVQTAQTINIGKVCRICGTEMIAGSIFCGNCGTKNEILPTPVINRAAIAQQKAKNKNIVPIIALSIVGLLVLGVLSAFVTKFLFESDMEESSSDSITETTAKAIAYTEAPTNTPLPRPTEKSVISAENNEYLFPLDSEIISTGFLDTKTQEEVRNILNELYARHGYTFTNTENIAYFNSKSWYRSLNKTMEECEREFNSFEKENQRIIVQYERDRGWR